jgi:ATP-dependent helicase HrpB
MPQPLPIDVHLPEILALLAERRNIVIEAAPGAGKTTRVPPALLSAVTGGIVVLEPRRIAARMAARRVASELGESPGETVGYQVRFEEVASARTRLRFVTEGVLTRRLLADPELRGINVVILDEFHERRLDSDLALALLRRLQLTSRPELKLVVMSATLESAGIGAYLDAPVVKSGGRVFEVDISYTPHSAGPLEEQVAAAVQRAVSETFDGDILVFLPGAAEIRRAAAACDGIARRSGLLVLPLHGDLSAEGQDRAVEAADRPKLILSTNVAESSITIDGVTTVIDTGLARIASDSPATGLPTLEIRRVSKASAVQRAGRAGRTRAGRALRLYPLEDFHRRPEHEIPEIRRRDLAQMLLELRALGVSDVPWFEAPSAKAAAAAEQLLDRLDARHCARELARYPVHPRLARLLLEGEKRGVAGEACRLAAVLSAGERIEDIDLLHALDGKSSYRVEQIERQLRRLVRSRSRGSGDGIAMAVLAAYPDRVAKRRAGREVQLCSGKAAVLAADFVPELLVAVDIEDRREAGPPLIRAACGIEAEWLLDLFPERITEFDEVVWNRNAERVEGVSSMRYDEVTLAETRGVPRDMTEASRLLAARALDAGLHRWTDVEALGALRARAEFAAGHSDIEPVTEEHVREALVDMSTGLRSFAELRQAGDLIQALRNRMGPRWERSLNEVAPERIPLKNRQVRVHYAPGQPPWIESRLQDFFGMNEAPRVARGQESVVVRLLAPNHRPVQVTSDLAGFWRNLYPQVRRELSRKYPKHAWPEKPV